MVYYPPKDVSEFGEMNDTLNGTRYWINDYIVGTIYCSVSSFYLMSYILCLYMICSDKALVKKPYYRIVIHMGATDLMQLTFNGIAAGAFTLKGSTDFVPNKVCGGLMNFCWVIFCAMAHLLALNRLVQVYASKTTANRIFSLCNTKIYLCSIWIYGAAWFICYMTPYISVLYSVESYDWNYSNNEVSLIFYWCELIQDTFHAACMVLWYSLIFIKLKLKVQILAFIQLELASLITKSVFNIQGESKVPSIFFKN